MLEFVACVLLARLMLDDMLPDWGLPGRGESFKGRPCSIESQTGSLGPGKSGLRCTNERTSGEKTMHMVMIRGQVPQ